jgi:hypothetical protein
MAGPPATLNPGQVTMLRMNKYAAFQLPAPDNGVRISCLEDRIGHQLVYRFRSAGIVVPVGDIGDEHPDSDGQYWAMSADSHAYLHENYDEPTGTPCGCSSGFRTVTAGEEYTCQNENCTETFGPDTAREVING